MLSFVLLCRSESTHRGREGSALDVVAGRNDCQTLGQGHEPALGRDLFAIGIYPCSNAQRAARFEQM